jgi:hypothetical protein
MTRYLLTAAFLYSAAPAMAQEPAQPQSPPCLRQINMYDFKFVPGNRSLIVIDRFRQRYRLNFEGVCYNIQYKLGLRFESHGTSRLSCLSKGDSVWFHDPAGPGWCVIHDIQYQTPALDQQDAAQAQAMNQH